MKKIVILPRKYYTHESTNFVAGQTVEIEDSEAEAAIAAGLASEVVEQEEEKEIE